MKIVNLFAGPGSGKSTGAAYVFSQLKLQGANTELITEFAKAKVYEKNSTALCNQVYMLGEQYKKQKDLCAYGVKIAVTDSPLMLGLFYTKDHNYFNEYVPLLIKLNQEFDNINIFINRTKPYDPKGRMQTEAESDAISIFLKESIGFDYTVNGDQAGYDQLVIWLRQHHLSKS